MWRRRGGEGQRKKEWGQRRRKRKRTARDVGRREIGNVGDRKCGVILDIL